MSIISKSLVSLLTLAVYFLSPRANTQGEPLVVEAVRVTGWEGCSKVQTKAIQQVFDDAINISNYVYTTYIDDQINWNGRAEAEFFGPNYLNSSSQVNAKSEFFMLCSPILRQYLYQSTTRTNMRSNVLYQASTYDRPYFFNPFGYWIHIRYDEWLSLPG